MYANHTTAPAGTRVRRAGTEADAPATGTVIGFHKSSIAVRHDNGSTFTAPVAHKGWIVATEPVETDPRTLTPEGRVLLAVQASPSVAYSERAVQRAEGILATATAKREAATDAARRTPTPVTIAAFHAADAAWSAAAHRVAATKATLAQKRADARSQAWVIETIAAETAADHAENPRTCRDCEAPLEVVGKGSQAAWVDARSGDVGGTYDICPAQYDAATDTQHGHFPA